MSDWREEYNELFERASAGDEAAIEHIIREFEPEIRMVARRQLGASLRPYLDSMDLVQSVNRVLFEGLRDEKFEISTKAQLIGLVSTMLRRKAAHHWRKLRRQQRDSHCAVSVEALADVVLALKAEADPADDVSHREQLEKLMAQLEDVDRDLLQLRLEGHSTAEAARRLGLNSDVLRVRLNRLRKRLALSPLMADLV